MRSILALLVLTLVVGCTTAAAGDSSPRQSAAMPTVSGAPATASTAPPSATVPPPSPPAPGMSRLEPAEGAYFGLNLDWGSTTAADAAAQLGRTPAVWVQFAPFPLDAAARANLDAFIEQVAAVDGLALITLEPHDGLATVTDATSEAFADLLAGYWTTHGVATFVRFAHEMNGSWYAWSQDPAAYVAAFRRVATAVHDRSPSSAMVWAPNQGNGYPFSGGPFTARPGSDAVPALDTDDDGALTARDDPYAPYYPGDEAVDWVGMSLYHWGLEHPWGENELPPEGAFAAMLRGDDIGAHATAGSVPDFYATYAEARDKPLAIVETGILYDPAASGGPTEPALKSAWFGQVFGAGTRVEFPRIGMINWFEWRKQEPEVGRVIDWRLGSDPSLARDLLEQTAEGWLRFAGD